MAKAVYAGSFNPFTIGHLSVLKRALPLFEKIYVVVGRNVDKDSAESVSISELQKKLIKYGNVEVAQWNGLTVDFAKNHNAEFLLRGVRSVADFEYEKNMADINKKLSGIETVLLFSDPEYASISSSMVRELQKFGVDVSKFII